MSDLSSDVCSSDLHIMRNRIREPDEIVRIPGPHAPVKGWMPPVEDVAFLELMGGRGQDMAPRCRWIDVQLREDILELIRSEEHTSELQSLMRISYAVFCLKKKNNRTR